MAAALEAGVTRLFRVGGAHAIAALAYGTATIPRVDKIVGPGNRYVAAAKALVAGDCAIDFYAGPTEIVIVAGGGRPAWIAADLVAQAEHDPDARAIFITWSRSLAERVAPARRAGAPGPRRSSRRSLAAHGAIDRRREPPTRRWRWPTASRPSISSSIASRSTRRPIDRRRGVRRPVHRAGRRRLRHRLEPRAADRRRGPVPRRPERRRLRARDVGAAADARRASRGWRRPSCRSRAPKGCDGARGIDRGAGCQVTMSHYQKPPELYDGLAAAPEREHRRLLAARARGAGARCAPDEIGFYPPYAGATRCVRRVSRRRSRPARARQRARRRDHGGSRSPICGRRSADRCSEAIVPEPAFEIFRVRHRGRRRPLVQVMPHADFSFPLDEVLAAITPRHARGLPDQPEQPDRRRRCRSTRFARSPARVPPEAVVFVDEAYAEFSGATFIPELAGVSQRHRRPDVLEGLRPGRPAHRLPRRRARRARPDARRRCRSTASTSPPSSRCRRRSRICDHLNGLPARRSRESKALLYAACDRLGLTVLEERRELRARLRRRSRRRARQGRGRTRHLPARPLDRAGLRRLPPHRHRHGRAHAPRASRRWKRSCAPRGNRSPDDGDADRAATRRSRARAATRCAPASASSITCWSCSRATAPSTCGSTATGDLDVDQHHTVEDLGIALGEAVSKALGDRRGINRAGYFVMPMDETLAVAAIDLGGRPHAVVDLKVTRRARRRSADRARPRLLRRLRDRRARERPRQGAVRPIEPPPDRSGVQGVRARAARRVREGQALARMLPSTKGLL